MRERFRGKHGFTLIELMIVIAILGIIAALAIPAFTTYVRRSKTAEVHETLKQLFNAASTYYTRHRVSSGLSAVTYSSCAIALPGTYTTDIAEGPSKQKPGPGAAPELGRAGMEFNLDNAYYYDYHVVVENVVQAPGTPAGVPANCGLEAVNSNTLRYNLEAYGDLDGDLEISTFELAVGVSQESELYHSAGIYIRNETE